METLNHGRSIFKNTKKKRSLNKEIVGSTTFIIREVQYSNGITNYSFNLNDFSDNEFISDDEISQKLNKLLRAKNLIKTILQMIEREEDKYKCMR